MLFSDCGDSFHKIGDEVAGYIKQVSFGSFSSILKSNTDFC